MYTLLDVRCFDVVTTFVFTTMSACLCIREQRCNNSHMLEMKCDTRMGFPYTRQAYQAPRDSNVWNYCPLGRHLGGLDSGHVLVTDDL
jgi:hypothetical protein